jgi:hypothetical protein
VSGDRAGGFEVICYGGDWYMFVFTVHSPASDASPAFVTVDGETHQASFARYGEGDLGITLNPVIIAALKTGNRVSISYGGFEAMFPLRGSSRALAVVEANCAYPTPSTDKNRFKTTLGNPNPEAAAVAEQLLASEIAEDRQHDPAIGIAFAGFIDLANGWRFVVADVGPSTAIYGIAGFYTTVIAMPPNEDWRVVDRKTAVATYVDSQGMTNGYPNIIYQNVRGVNQPFGLWTWNGEKYVHTRTIAQ